MIQSLGRLDYFLLNDYLLYEMYHHKIFPTIREFNFGDTFEYLSHSTKSGKFCQNN